MSILRWQFRRVYSAIQKGIIAVLGLIVWAVAVRSSLPQDSLQGLRDNVRRPPLVSRPKEEPKSSPKEEESHSHHGDGPLDHDDDWDDLKTTLFLIGLLGIGAVVTSPYWVPIKLMEDDYKASGYFPRHPYVADVEGYMMIDPWVPAEPYCWSVQARMEYAGDFQDSSRYGGHILFDTTSRFGVESAFDFRRQNTAVGVVDELWTGDFNVVYRFAQSARLQMRSGIGFNWLSDTVGTENGFNFTYGGDWFPAKPWVISSEIDWGRLGSATLFHFRATAGVEFHGVEIYTGYDYYDVGTSQLDGIVAGVRFWF